MHQAILKPKEERRLRRGHLWAYRNEFASLPDIEDGALLDVLSDRKQFVGRGFYQAKGGIAVRILTPDHEDIDTTFLQKRIDEAKTFRARIYPGQDTYRWIYGESDGLPGLIADRYATLVVAQAASSFYADAANDIAGLFMQHEGVEGVLLTIGEDERRFGTVEIPAECTINNLTFTVDPVAGQKTGLFLDQRENWKLLERFAEGAKVLDGHCYAGAWSLHAAKYGATEVLGIDTSKSAIEMAKANAALNNAQGTCRFDINDIQKVLVKGDKWDVIILDPPALAKSKAYLKKAQGLYQAMNRDAMKALTPGGILITSSCSQPIDSAALNEILKRAANSAQRRTQLLGTSGPAPDHPSLISMPETRYLTCAVVRVL